MVGISINNPSGLESDSQANATMNRGIAFLNGLKPIKGNTIFSKTKIVIMISNSMRYAKWIENGSPTIRPHNIYTKAAVRAKEDFTKVFG